MDPHQNTSCDLPTKIIHTHIRTCFSLASKMNGQHDNKSMLSFKKSFKSYLLLVCHTKGNESGRENSLHNSNTPRVWSSRQLLPKRLPMRSTRIVIEKKLHIWMLLLYVITIFACFLSSEMDAKDFTFLLV